MEQAGRLVQGTPAGQAGQVGRAGACEGERGKRGEVGTGGAGWSSAPGGTSGAHKMEMGHQWGTWQQQGKSEGSPPSCPLADAMQKHAS